LREHVDVKALNFNCNPNDLKHDEQLFYKLFTPFPIIFRPASL
jgi:hypothetical protein